MPGVVERKATPRLEKLNDCQGEPKFGSLLCQTVLGARRVLIEVGTPAERNKMGHRSYSR